MNDHSRPLIHELNNRAWNLADHCRALGLEMDVKNFKDDSGCRILDFAVGRSGTVSAGISLAMICMADLAEIQVLPANDSAFPLRQVQVATDHPIAACIASQYAGWPLQHADYFAMCSGPARMARGKEELLTDYDLEFSMERVVGVLESNQLPDTEAIGFFAEECCVTPQNVTLCVARTASLPGAIQVVARSIETAMHKLHELKFDLKTIKNAIGNAPLPPIPNDDLKALGWTNDSILYGASVQLWVDCDDEVIQTIGPQVPSCSSTDFGASFGELFAWYDHDFYKMDKMLFSPAQIVFNSLQTGNTFVFGEVRNDILSKSFGLV